ncbi:MAG: hypothetical protein LAQ69_09070 [Acidobacteriia bacterium]|nr:hypothetical protein [Terriglobia bacterium]
MNGQDRKATASFRFPVALAVLLMVPGIAPAQGKGWIEGTVLNKSGKIVWDTARAASIVTVRALGPSKVETHPDYAMGNFYTMRDLKPGVYEVFVSSTKDDESQYRPQHIMGLVVKPGVRTLLNVVVHEGRSDALDEVGKAVPTETATTLAEMVEHLTREVELLKKQVGELRK